MSQGGISICSSFISGVGMRHSDKNETSKQKNNTYEISVIVVVVVLLFILQFHVTVHHCG